MSPRDEHRARSGTIILCGVLLLFGLGGLAHAEEPMAITPDNVVQRVTEARTPADHAALAAYFRAKAAASADRVKWHEEMIQSYKMVGGRPLQIWKPHCESLIRAARAKQKSYVKQAIEQEQLSRAALR